MVLEQWEIDLRQQLEGKINCKEEKMETKVNMENLSKKEYMNNTIIMLVVLIILCVAMIFIYNSKNSKNDAVVIQSPTNYDVQIASLRSDIEKVESDGVTSNEKLKSRIQENNDRLSIMGMLITENFLIVRNNHDKNDLVFFNRDWSLNKMPKHLRLSDEDKEYLKKFTPNQ